MIPEAKNYRKELMTLGYGRPVYDPNPGNYDRARIGDVGYFEPFDSFRRLFNVLYSANDDININGVPNGFVPMGEECRQWHPSQPILPGVICHSCVRKIGGDLGANINVLPVGARFALSCTERRWAALVISRPAIRKNASRGGAFRKYIINNHKAWLEFARDSLEIEISLEDLVLVTGLDMTHEWATASAVEWNREGEVSLDVNFSGSGRLAATAWCSWRSSVSLPLRFGPFRPSSPDPNDNNIVTPDSPAWPGNHLYTNNADSRESDNNGEPDQCVFMRGFRMIPRRIILPKRIKAAAEPKDENENEEDEGTIAVSIGMDSDDGFGSGEDGALDDQSDAFKAVQDYIFMNSDADYAVLHDDDLYKFNALHDDIDDNLHKLDKHEAQDLYLNLETVNGNKFASLAFREGGGEARLGKLTATNQASARDTQTNPDETMDVEMSNVGSTSKRPGNIFSRRMASSPYQRPSLAKSLAESTIDTDGRVENIMDMMNRSFIERHIPQQEQNNVQGASALLSTLSASTKLLGEPEYTATAHTATRRSGRKR